MTEGFGLTGWLITGTLVLAWITYLVNKYKPMPSGYWKFMFTLAAVLFAVVTFFLMMWKGVWS